MPVTPRRLLTIAGSDSGGGAGIQADLKSFAAHGCHGMSVVTAITAQNTLEVRAVHEAPAELVGEQIDAVFEDIGVDAVKIGMLGSAGIIRAVAAGLERHPRVPVVLDPVMVAKSGDPLLRDDAVEALKAELLPLATLLTPNAPEAARLTGRPVGNAEQQEAAGRQLAREGAAVLVKGGHLSGDEVVDLLVEHGGAARRFVHRRVATRSTHGTGCTLSSAIAARLAGGEELERAVAGGIEYLQGALRSAFPLGQGHGPVNHFHSWDGWGR